MFCKKMIQIYDPHHVLHRVETFRWNFNMFSDIQICKTEMKLDFFMIFCPCKNNIVFASLNIWEIGFISFMRNLKCVCLFYLLWSLYADLVNMHYEIFFSNCEFEIRIYMRLKFKTFCYLSSVLKFLLKFETFLQNKTNTLANIEVSQKESTSWK